MMKVVSFVVDIAVSWVLAVIIMTISSFVVGSFITWTIYYPWDYERMRALIAFAAGVLSLSTCGCMAMEGSSVLSTLKKWINTK